MTRWEEVMFKNIESSAESFIDIKESYLGRIKSINPLQVIIRGMPIDSKSLVINTELLDHEIEFTKFKGIIGDTVKTYTDGSILVKSSLKIDDYVVCRELSNGMYLISCKVKVGG